MQQDQRKRLRSSRSGAQKVIAVSVYAQGAFYRPNEGRPGFIICIAVKEVYVRRVSTKSGGLGGSAGLPSEVACQEIAFKQRWLHCNASAFSLTVGLVQCRAVNGAYCACSDAQRFWTLIEKQVLGNWAAWASWV